MKNILLRIFILLLVSGSAFAEQGTGIGGVAQNMMEPVSVVSDFVHTACLLIGAGFLFASIVKYFEHRRSPLMVPISTVVFLFIAGLVLIALPLVAYVTENGVAYSSWGKR